VEKKTPPRNTTNSSLALAVLVDAKLQILAELLIEFLVIIGIFGRMEVFCD